MQTIITVITVDCENVVQDCDAFFGNDEQRVVFESEAFFRKRCSELFGSDWDDLPEKEKEACLENGFFDIHHHPSKPGEVTNIYINWPTRHAV